MMIYCNSAGKYYIIYIRHTYISMHGLLCIRGKSLFTYHVLLRNRRRGASGIWRGDLYRTRFHSYTYKIAVIYTKARSELIKTGWKNAVYSVHVHTYIHTAQWQSSGKLDFFYLRVYILLYVYTVWWSRRAIEIFLFVFSFSFHSSKVAVYYTRVWRIYIKRITPLRVYLLD